MGNERTADELRAYRLNKLGQNLGQVFHALSNDVAWLQVKWAEYRELFGTSSERIDILNSAAVLSHTSRHALGRHAAPLREADRSCRSGWQV